MTDFLFGIEEPITAIVVGARGGLGEAFTQLIANHNRRHRVVATSRDENWCKQAVIPRTISRYPLDITSSESAERLTLFLKDNGLQPNVIINCSGLLHNGLLGPERSIREFDIEKIRQVFDVNAFGVAILLRHLVPLLPRDRRAVFASISAKVGSIGDNRLGGWYSYRASKAAQNMFIKTASIETKRGYPNLVCTALHPGTVDTDLSAPYTKRTPPEKLFSSDFSAQRLASVIGGLTPRDSGNFFAYDGTQLPW